MCLCSSSTAWSPVCQAWAPSPHLASCTDLLLPLTSLAHHLTRHPTRTFVPLTSLAVLCPSLPCCPSTLHLDTCLGLLSPPALPVPAGSRPFCTPPPHPPPCTPHLCICVPVCLCPAHACRPQAVYTKIDVRMLTASAGGRGGGGVPPAGPAHVFDVDELLSWSRQGTTPTTIR